MPNDPFAEITSLEAAKQVIHSLRQELVERERSHQEDIAHLRESREQWRSLVENAQEVILHVRRDSTIEFVNHMRDRPDLTNDQLVGQSVLSFVVPEYREVALQFLATVFDRREAAEAEVLAESAYGVKKWYACHASPIWSGETFEKVTVVCRNITDSKLARERILRMDQERIKLCRAAVAGTVAAGLAHQLNQPLTVLSTLMVGARQLLADQNLSLKDATFIIQNLDPEISQILELVHGWQRFIRRDDSRIVDSDVNTIVEGAIALASPLAELNRVSIRSSLMSPNALILVEPVHVQQAILNIIVNGVEAVRELDASRREVLVTTEEHDSTVLVRIRDLGAGFDEVRLNDVFVPFVSTKPAGLGMGLTISHGIAESHRGSLEVRNHHQRGAEVTFRFPAVE